MERIPLLAEEGWLRHQSEVAKPPKSRRRGGQSGHIRDSIGPDPSNGKFLTVIVWPQDSWDTPLQGGECACPESVANITGDTTLEGIL